VHHIHTSNTARFCLTNVHIIFDGTTEKECFENGFIIVVLLVSKEEAVVAFDLNTFAAFLDLGI
jgi:hypothetical protein